jgi:hypothetical protein
MPGELDGVVDSISSSPRDVPGVRLTRGEAFTALGDSPAVDPRTANYHLDIPVDQRPAFAKSAREDGGLSVLATPNPLGGAAKSVLLAEDQSDLRQGTVVARPRSLEMHKGNGPAKPGSGVKVSSEDVGLALRPIMIQRQADVDDMGVPLDPDGIRKKTFLSDGTSKGGRLIDETRKTTVEDAQVKQAAAVTPPDNTAALVAAAAAGDQAALIALIEKRLTPAPAAQLQPNAAAPMPVAKPVNRQRVVFMPDGGGKVRSQVDEVIIGNNILILIYDANADSSYEPPKSTAAAPLRLQIGDKQFSCLYADWSAEHGGKLYLVFILIPGDAAS